jgi:hypothetical protein
VTGYGLDGPVIKSRWGGEIFRTCPDRPWGPTCLLCNGYQVFPGGTEWPGLESLTPHPFLVSWSGKSRAIPLLPLWAIWPAQSLSACKRVHFTFFRPDTVNCCVTADVGSMFQYSVSLLKMSVLYSHSEPILEKR